MFAAILTAFVLGGSVAQEQRISAVAASSSPQSPMLEVLLGREALGLELGPTGLSLYWSRVPGATAYRITRVGRDPITVAATETSYSYFLDWARSQFSLTDVRIEPIDVSVTALRDGRELSTVRRTVPCPSVGFIAARGSGQNRFGSSYGLGLGDRGARFLATLRERMAVNEQALPAIAVNYEAVEIIGPGLALKGAVPSIYNHSVREGVSVAELAVLKTLNACPNISLILFGYSQGAQVIGDVFADLPAKARQRVARVILFADATYQPNDTRVRYLPTSLSGKGIKGARAPFPTDDGAVIESWCWVKDIVCQGPPRTAQHGDIYDTYERQAAINAFLALPRIEPPRPDRVPQRTPTEKTADPCKLPAS